MVLGTAAGLATGILTAALWPLPPPNPLKLTPFANPLSEYAAATPS
jgi:hypothetical protein